MPTLVMVSYYDGVQTRLSVPLQRSVVANMPPFHQSIDTLVQTRVLSHLASHTSLLFLLCSVVVPSICLSGAESSSQSDTCSLMTDAITDHGREEVECSLETFNSRKRICIGISISNPGPIFTGCWVNTSGGT